MKEQVNALVGVIMSVLLFLYGRIDTPLIVFFIAVLFDYITGILKGIYHKDLSSVQGFRGLIKKFCMCMILAFGVQLDKLVGSEGMIRNFIIFYYVANEGISILENLIDMDIPFPTALIDVLSQIKKKSEDK